MAWSFFNRLSPAYQSSAPVVRILHNLEQANTPTARQILQTIGAIADKYNLHDDVLDGILADLFNEPAV
jgi:hypothetical protein